MFGVTKVLAASRRIPTGEQTWTAAGATAWVVPAGVTSLSGVSVGPGGGAVVGGYGGSGGGLAWANSIPVTPGETLYIEVAVGVGSSIERNTVFCGLRRGATWLLKAGNGAGSNAVTKLGGQKLVGDGGRTGGAGSSNRAGGGAAGYSGDGTAGAAAGAASAAATGGAASGGGGYTGSNAGSGGGVGLFGEGASGESAGAGVGGRAGSSGSNGSPSGDGAAYGGGAAGVYLRNGGAGAVRLIWGYGRSFPSNAA